MIGPDRIVRMIARILGAVAIATLVGATAYGATSTLPKPLEGVGVEQKLDQPLPLDLAFRDETGKAVKLGDYFGDKPVLLTLAYYHCPMLCPMVLEGLSRSLRPLSLRLGSDFRAVTVGIDPKETSQQAAAMKRKLEAGDDWHFLVGDEAAIRRLAETVGFHYTIDSANDQFAHAAVLLVATPDGRMSRYLYGIDFTPRDVRLALVEASQGKIGTLADQLLLFCFHYDPATGRYGTAAMTSLRVAGILTVAGLVGFIATQLRRERLG